jgi:c-di-GMP-binding flagellar brake protein YcgR
MDRRFAPRYPVNLPVELTLNPGDGASPTSFRGTTKDISQTGVKVFSERTTSIGSRIRLRFAEFNASAEVVWVVETEVTGMALLGLTFVGVESSGREAFQCVLEEARRALQAGLPQRVHDEGP